MLFGTVMIMTLPHPLAIQNELREVWDSAARQCVAYGGRSS